MAQGFLWFLAIGCGFTALINFLDPMGEAGAGYIGLIIGLLLFAAGWSAG